LLKSILAHWHTSALHFELEWHSVERIYLRQSRWSRKITIIETNAG